MNEKTIYSVCEQLIDTVRKITQNSTNNFSLISVQMEKSTSQKQHLGNQKHVVPHWYLPFVVP